MAPELADVNPEALLAHAAFLRGLARALLRDGHEADEAVQHAWLAALEQRTLRRPGSLRAWLAAVVHNFARNHHRDTAHRRVREARGARPEAVFSSAEIAMREAVRQEVLEAVLALAEPYRSTILRRYYEGLPPREIARRTGVPAATVRTHLHRGLDQLRERLDAHHGGDRRAWGVPLVVWAMPKTALLTGLAFLRAAAVVVVFGLATVVGGAIVSTPNAPVSGTLPAVEPVVAASAGRVAQDPSVAASRRIEVRSPAAAQAGGGGGAGPAGESATVTGRVVTASEHAPILGARVRVQGWRSEPVRSDATGRFTVVAAPHEHGRLSVEVEGAGERLAFLDPLVAGRTQDVGDLVLPPTFGLTGLVEDEEHRPVGGVQVSIVVPDLRGRVQMMGLNGHMTGMRVANDGSFAFTGLPAGSYQIFPPRTEALMPASAPMVRVPVPEGTPPLVLTMRTAPALEVTFVDDDGEPIELEHGGGLANGFARLNLHLLRDNGPSVNASRWPSPTRGTVRWSPNDATTLEATFGILVSGPGWQLLRTPQTYRFGGPPVRVTVPRAQVVDLTVVDAATQAPVDVFTAWLGSSQPRNGRFGTADAFPAAAGSSGRLRVPMAQPGLNRLRVLSDGYVMSDAIDFTAAGPTHLAVSLRRGGTARVRVLDELGAALPGAEVSAIELDNRATRQWRPDLLFTPAQMAMNPGAEYDTLWSKAASDASGIVSLGPLPDRGLEILVNAPGRPPALRTAVRVGEGATIDLEVRCGLGVAVRGVCTPLTALQPGDQIAAVLQPASVPLHSGAIAADGTFTLAGVAAGLVDLHLVRKTRGVFGATTDARLTPALLQLTVGTTEPAPVSLDLRRFVLRDLDVEVVTEGALPPGLAVMARPVDGTPAPAPVGAVAVDVQGRVRIPQIYAGSYEMLAAVRDSRGAQRMVALVPRRITLDTATTPVRLEWISRTATVRLVRATDGAPIAAAELRFAGSELWDTRRTDARGEVRLEHLPDGVITVAEPGAAQPFATLTIGLRERESTFTVRR